MIQFYVMMIKNGKMTLTEVPLLWKERVESVLDIKS